MKRVGITGVNGFIGTNLKHYLALFGGDFTIVDFKREWFEDEDRLKDFVMSCDAIVHLAGVNRHPDPSYVEERNLQITARLLAALVKAEAAPQLIFASSTQEDRGTPYARAKVWARLALAEWAASVGADYSGLIIPNVFGPFGEPYYHSVVTTFCHQLHTGEEPSIITDAEISFTGILEVCRSIRSALLHPTYDPAVVLATLARMRVSELLEKLRGYHARYAPHFEIPELKDAFDVALFNTYRSFIDPGSYPFYLKQHSDERGSLAEVIRANTGGQVFFSTTRPGVTRGNHFHLRKVERFCVLKGEALIRLRKTGTKEIISIAVSGDRPSLVDMPIWYTHNITNTGKEELLTLFWSSEFYDPEDTDTWYEEV